MAVRKTHSHSDLTELPADTSSMFPKERCLPPSPPTAPKWISTPSVSASGGDETPKPIPRKKKKKKAGKKAKSPVLPTRETSEGEEGRHESLGQYGYMLKIASTDISPRAGSRSPLYQRIDLKSRDAPVQYETLDLYHKK